MDIEGTTTSISFVHDILFPYSSKHLAKFIQNNVHNPEIAECLRQIASVAKTEGRMLCGPGDIQIEIQRWISEDRKHSALKKIQGMIWREGYDRGELKGHVYPDVPEVLKKWHKEGLQLGIYSSGSVEAQRLIFGQSIAGNLNVYLSFNFDTSVGTKRDSQSYKNILQQLNVKALNLLFLSDIVEELNAAAAVGINTGLLLRDNSATTMQNTHPVFHNFHDIK